MGTPEYYGLRQPEARSERAEETSVRPGERAYTRGDQVLGLIFLFCLVLGGLYVKEQVVSWWHKSDVVYVRVGVPPIPLEDRCGPSYCVCGPDGIGC